MKKTLQDQYLLIKEGKGHAGVFLTEAKRQFPNIIRNAATFDEAVASLKTKNIISENVFSVMPAIMDRPKKESYETAFEDFLAEAKKKNDDEKVKAEEKKVSKPVEEDLEKAFNYSDEKNPDNMIFDQIMTGYYAEMKDPKNADKTMQELKDIVFKNLSKDQIYYTKNGQFGIKDLGYVTEAPGLGEPKEAKGKYKFSGYGDLNEGIFDMFKSKPLGDVEGAKKQALNAFRAWVEKNAGLADPKSLNDDQIIEKIKAFAKRNPSNMVHQLWNQSKHLFEIDNPIEKFKSDFEDLATNKKDSKFSPEEIKAKLKQKREEELKRRKEAGESLEELSVRKAIQEMIDIEMEEAYQLVNINPQKSDKERGEREPQPFKMSYVDPSVIDSLTKNQHLRILRSPSNPENITLAIRARFVPTSAKNVGKNTDNLDKLPLDIPSDFKNFLTDKNNITGEKQLPTKEGVTELYKILSNATLNKNGSLVLKVPNPNYEKTMESLQESVEKDLADINKEAEHEVLQAKLDKIDALIDHRRSKLTKLDEDEDMKALTDKKKVKELEKDIKKLEVARKKIDKMMSKFKGKKVASKDVIDEVEDDEELPLETPKEASEEYLQYKEDAENRYDAGESIDSILDNYNNISLDMKNMLRNDLEGKMDGMDY
jgi:hypothetical protein